MNINRGFLLYAEGENYITQAYLCALSIKTHGNKYPVSVVVCEDVPQKYADAFDNIITINKEKNETIGRFKTEQRLKLYDISPYDETIILDVDVLVQEDLEYWWTFVSKYDVYYPTKAYTHEKKLIVNNNDYRYEFIANDLANVYNGIFFFRKNNKSKEFFEILKRVSNHWRMFYKKYIPIKSNKYLNTPSMDDSTAVVVNILNMKNTISSTDDPLYFVHMKPRIYGWEDSWQNHLSVEVTDDVELIVGGILQNCVFHYTEDSFVKDDMIRKYEQKYENIYGSEGQSNGNASS